MVKKFLVLGSCRVVNTIAKQNGDNIILNEKDLWFTHYIQEHIQKVKHLFEGNLLPAEHKELFVRYEQQSHYGSNSSLKVGESINTGAMDIENRFSLGTLNVVVEIPTIRYIKVPIEGKFFWGHSTNLELIQASPFNQEGGYSTDEEFLELLNYFELIVSDLIFPTVKSEAINFIYVPHSPFIEMKGGGWGESEQRVHISDLINIHCGMKPLPTKIPLTRSMLDIKSMINENGGVDKILKDQNHYSVQGVKVAFKHLDELAQ